jgi:polyhydroxyalkanoate synthesis regulator phasin
MAELNLKNLVLAGVGVTALSVEKAQSLVLAGVGATAVSMEKVQDKAQGIVSELVKKGEETVQQGKTVNTELKHTVSEKLRTAADTLEAQGEAETKSEASPVVVEMVEVDGKLVDKLADEDKD